MTPQVLHARRVRLWRHIQWCHAEADRLDAYAVSLADALAHGEPARPCLTVTLAVRPEEAGAFWRSGILPIPLVERLGKVLQECCRAARVGEQIDAPETVGQGSLFEEEAA